MVSVGSRGFQTGVRWHSIASILACIIQYIQTVVLYLGISNEINKRNGKCQLWMMLLLLFTIQNIIQPLIAVRLNTEKEHIIQSVLYDDSSFLLMKSSSMLYKTVKISYWLFI